MSTRREPIRLEPRPPLAWMAELERRFPNVDPSALLVMLRLINVGNALTSAFEPHFRRLGLTEARFTLVMTVYRMEHEAGAATPSALAEHAGIGRAAMSQMLDGLAEADWIERDPDPEDRRRIAVRLTRRGRRRLERYLPGHYERVSAIMQGLSKADRAALRSLLDAVDAGLEKLS